VSNTPTEILERKFPLEVLEKNLIPNSGGRGKYRGGLSQRVVLSVTNPEGLTATLLSQRLKYPPVGRQGGENGSLEKILLNGKLVQGDLPFQLKQGDIFELELPGGGGFGPAEQRDLTAIKLDQDAGYVSINVIAP
jgi:N-methylhydantoinase B